MRIVLLFLAALLFAGSGHAQEPLTLSEALTIVKQNNLQLKKQELQKKVADLEVAIKKGQLLPALDITATTAYTDKVSTIEMPTTLTGGRLVEIELGGRDRTDLSVGLRQPLFTGFQLRTQVDLAKSALATEEVQLAFVNQQIAYQVEVVFYQSQMLKKERRIQQASLSRLSVQLQQVRNLFEAAQAMAFDTLRVYNQSLQLKIQMDQNARDQRLLDLQMSRLLDLESVRPIADAELKKPAPIQESLEVLKQRSVENRPELTRIRIGQHMAQLNRKLARGNYFPTIGVEARYHYAKPGLNQVANEWMGYASVGVNFQWNLWRWQQDHNRIQQTEITFDRLTLEEKELLHSIDFEVEKGLENTRFAAKQIELLEKLLDQQQERYRIVSEQQRQGVATTNDMVVAEADLTLAELQLQRAMIQYHLSAAELALATGTITE